MHDCSPACACLAWSKGAPQRRALLRLTGHTEQEMADHERETDAHLDQVLAQLGFEAPRPVLTLIPGGKP